MQLRYAIGPDRFKTDSPQDLWCAFALVLAADSSIITALISINSLANLVTQSIITQLMVVTNLFD